MPSPTPDTQAPAAGQARGSVRESYILTIPLCPIPKMRPRMVHGGHAYMPPRYRAWIEEAQHMIQQAWPHEPIEGLLDVRILLSGPKRPRGDLDNLCGAVWDACNGLVWGDDRQIEAMSCRVGAAADWAIDLTIYPLEPLTYPKPTRRKAKP